MVQTYKTIKNVRFPVYFLPSSNWHSVDGLLYVDNRLVDDKNMPGTSLGVRRLQTPFKELQPLKSSVDTLVGVLKNSRRAFIDSNGVPFTYLKTYNSKLSYYKIKKVLRKEEASLLWVDGVNNFFRIPRPPAPEVQYAGILHFGGLPWLLYDYSITKQKSTRRKI